MAVSLTASLGSPALRGRNADAPVSAPEVKQNLFYFGLCPVGMQCAWSHVSTLMQGTRTRRVQTQVTPKSFVPFLAQKNAKIKTALKILVVYYHDAGVAYKGCRSMHLRESRNTYCLYAAWVTPSQGKPSSVHQIRSE